MGDVLAELEEVLRSKPTKEKITQREEFVLQACKARAIRDFTVGSCVSSAIVWAATRNFTPGKRFNTSVEIAGSAMLLGTWRFNRSLNSCLDQILGFEGSRMQKELAHIILTKHHHNASRVKLVRKHFYPEQVFSDSNPDQPLFRWRSRNLYYDGSVFQRNEDPEYGSFQEKPEDQQPKQLMRNIGSEDMVGDPLDCVFGQERANTEIAYSNKNEMPRRRLRANKRAHRRHRSRHAENSPNDTSFDD